MWLSTQRDSEPSAYASTKDDQPPLVWLVIQRGEVKRVSPGSPQADHADEAA